MDKDSEKAIVSSAIGTLRLYSLLSVGGMLGMLVMVDEPKPHTAFSGLCFGLLLFTQGPEFTQWADGDPRRTADQRAGHKIAVGILNWMRGLAVIWFLGVLYFTLTGSD